MLLAGKRDQVLELTKLHGLHSHESQTYAPVTTPYDPFVEVTRAQMRFCTTSPTIPTKIRMG